MIIRWHLQVATRIFQNIKTSRLIYIMYIYNFNHKSSNTKNIYILLYIIMFYLQILSMFSIRLKTSTLLFLGAFVMVRSTAWSFTTRVMFVVFTGSMRFRLVRRVGGFPRFARLVLTTMWSIWSNFRLWVRFNIIVFVQVS